MRGERNKKNLKKNIKNLLIQKKEIKDRVIKDRIIRYIRALFED